MPHDLTYMWESKKAAYIEGDRRRVAITSEIWKKRGDTRQGTKLPLCRMNRF